ncbi:MAG: rhodanese-like domain-containing protein [Verrucomicrobia bacterium]|nr:rhodanese-like domain-containing protein [Verrucomicrobiota bacterium]
MPEELLTDAFLTRPAGVPVIDVRTPDEFALGHIPGAVNVPIFSNAERAAIGTAYKRDGRHLAVSLGLRCVGPRLEELAHTLLALTDRLRLPRGHPQGWLQILSPLGARLVRHPP